MAVSRRHLMDTGTSAHGPPPPAAADSTSSSSSEMNMASVSAIALWTGLFLIITLRGVVSVLSDVNRNGWSTETRSRWRFATAAMGAVAVLAVVFRAAVHPGWEVWVTLAAAAVPLVVLLVGLATIGVADRVPKGVREGLRVRRAVAGAGAPLHQHGGEGDSQDSDSRTVEIKAALL